MRKVSRLILICMLLVLVLTACKPAATPEPTMPPSPEIPVETEGVSFKTLVAGTLTAVAQTMQATDYMTPTETATITFTPLPTVPPPPTPTEVVVSLTMTGDTYCRKGPAAFYPSVTILKSGMIAEILGRDAYDYFVYVQTSEFTCWVSSEYGTISGDIAILPVFTPQPTAMPTHTVTPPATSTYTVEYVGLTACEGGYALNFNITNSGRIKLESVRITSLVQGDEGKYIHASDTFTQYSGGVRYQTNKELLVGESAIVSTCKPGSITYDPTGKLVTSTVVVCSVNGLVGSCLTKELEFTPH